MLKRAALTALAALALASCQPAPIHHWTEAAPEVQAAHAPAEIQAFIDAYWRQVWIDTYNYRKWMAAAVAYEARKAEAAAYPHGLCGGDLPPCWVMRRESKGDIRVWNGICYAPIGYAGRYSPCGGSSASGKWQIVRGTWAGFGGYLNAADAPEAVQDARARQLWAHGRGCSHWSACR